MPKQYRDESGFPSSMGKELVKTIVAWPVTIPAHCISLALGHGGLYKSPFHISNGRQQDYDRVVAEQAWRRRYDNT